MCYILTLSLNNVQIENINCFKLSKYIGLLTNRCIHHLLNAPKEYAGQVPFYLLFYDYSKEQTCKIALCFYISRFK